MYGYNNQEDYSFTTQSLNPYNQPEVSNPPSDSISKVCWVPNPQQSILCCSSWDCSVSCWNVNVGNQGVNTQSILKINHQAPVLTCTATSDGKLFTGGCDNIGKCISLSGNNLMGNTNSVDLMKHDNCIKAVCHVPEINSVISGGWDQKIRFWDSRLTNQNHLNEQKLPERVYAMDVKNHLLGVCCGGSAKAIGIFDLRKIGNVLHQTQSELRLQTRSFKFIPQSLGVDGFVVGSVEGRCSVQFFGNSSNQKSFAFKCHREGKGKTKKNCFAVNDFSFHPRFSTLATCGSNGRFSFWDLKQRTKTYSQGKRFSVPITSAQFNPRGDFYAVAVGYDFSQGTNPPAYKDGFTSKIILQRNQDKWHQ